MSPTRQRRERLVSRLPLAAATWLGLGACVDAPISSSAPELDGFGARIIAIGVEAGPGRFFRAEAGDPSFALVTLGPEDVLYLFDYECPEIAALGFRSIGGDVLDPPAGPVRAPDRSFRLDRSSAPRIVELDDDGLAAALLHLGLEGRSPSSCRFFELAPVALRYEANQRSRFLQPLPDQSVLLMTVVEDEDTDDYRLYAYRFFSPTEFETYELPDSAPASASSVDHEGKLWLYGRSGAFAFGDPDDLGAFEARFQTMPMATRAHNCTDPVAGSHNDSLLDVLTETGSIARALTVDGSGTLQLFLDGRWTMLHDPVSPEDKRFLCNVTPSEVSWVDSNTALLLNRSVLEPSPQVVRITLDGEGNASFSDDGVPDTLEGIERLLDRGSRGIWAGGSRGRLGRREGGRWTRVEPDLALTRNVATLFEGPGGSLIAGNGGEGLVQYWPDANGGPLACATAAITSRVRDAGSLPGDYVIALPSNEGVDRAVHAWKLRPAEACELPPN